MLATQRIGFCLALILGIPFSGNAAQKQVGTERQFEVVSIRANRSGELNYRIRTPAGEGFTATNVTAKTLLLQAFNIKTFQLAGTPGWIDSERYDITAKLDSALETSKMLSPEELAPLLQNLLASRFQLVIHRVSKQMPVFSLASAKGGPKLNRNAGTLGHQTDWGKGHINAQDVTLAEFCRVLETQLDRVVIDDTKIPGTFDFRLTWTPDLEQTVDSSGPSIFTALREQYGLELKPRRGPVEVIVVDRIERPSGN
jgi:uncharacterized protein (TIGR03435 family)